MNFKLNQFSTSFQIFGEDRSISSLEEDDEDDVYGIPLIPNPPHNDYNPGGTNTLYTVFLIVNAALGAGKIFKIWLNVEFFVSILRGH